MRLQTADLKKVMIRDEGREFTNLREGHELYCAGHLIEAGVAYYKATGKRKLLDICCRMADQIIGEFHTERLMRGIPGHEEIELALIRLYEETDNGANLEQLLADTDTPPEEIYDPKELGGMLKLRAKGYRSVYPEWDADQLYAPARTVFEPTELTYVPYAYWGNRTSGEMIVWTREKQ